MTQTLTDHDDIRRWARQHGATPARVKGTGRGDDANALLLQMGDTSAGGRLEPIDWDAWFQRFDDGRLALIVDDTAGSSRLVQREQDRADDERADDLFEDEFDDDFEDEEEDDEDETASR